MQKNIYIKSPLNYVGGKFKLLPQILPLFPKQINTFIDLFGGGFNVGINVEANKIIYNDIIIQITELYSFLANNLSDKCLKDIDTYIEIYQLNKHNKEGFVKLRKYYNEIEKTPIAFYVLVCHAFNNQIRFNKDSKYNMPFGKDRSSFNPILRQKFINFVNELHIKNIEFYSKDFRDFDLELFTYKDFFYLDPPYFNSTASYNESGAWNEKDEKDLLTFLNQLNNKNIKFALSNNFAYNNPILKQWIMVNDFNMHYLNADYNNCNYQKKDKSKKNLEILITNY